MDLPRFDPAKIKVSRAPPAASESLVDIVLRGFRANLADGGLPGLFGIFPQQSTVHTPGRGKRVITNRQLVTRAKQIAFDPTKIFGID